MTIGESFKFQGQTVTVMNITRDDLTNEIVVISLRVAPNKIRVFWGVWIDQILQARAASLPGRTS